MPYTKLNIIMTEDVFEKEIIIGRKPSVIVFGAEWSGNSAMMDSMMERLSKEFTTGVHFYKVDLEKQPEISTFFGVHSVPTMVMLKDGEVVEFIEGFVPARKVREKIKEIYIS